MAELTIATIANEMQTSIHGRKLGVDRYGNVIGPAGYRTAVTLATSDTTGTVLPSYGFVSVDSTTDDTWLLGPPVRGALLTIYTGSTSTGIRTIKRNASTFAIRTSAASTNTTIVAQAGGKTIDLFGLTTAIYALVQLPGSTEIALNGTT